MISGMGSFREYFQGYEDCYTIIGGAACDILMHDAADKHATVEALPQIIETIQAMEDTEILPITEDTNPVQHLHR